MNQWPVLEASVERLCEKMRVCEFMRAVTCACGVRVLGVSNKSVRVCIHALICICVCEPEWVRTFICVQSHVLLNLINDGFCCNPKMCRYGARVPTWLCSEDEPRGT